MFQHQKRLCTIVNHLEVERLSFVDVVEVLHGDDQAQLQDGQAWRRKTQTWLTWTPRDVSLKTLLLMWILPWSMLALASAKHSLLASRRSAGLMVGLATETRLRDNICMNNEATLNVRLPSFSQWENSKCCSHQQHVHWTEVFAGVELSL